MADQKRTHQAPSELAAVAPRYADYTANVLFGDVWERDGLSNRDKSLVTCAALIAVNRAAYLQFHAKRALDNGLTPRELSETVAHLAFYCGWPMATAAAYELVPIYEERGIGTDEVAALDAPLLDYDLEAEAARKTSVATNVGPTSPDLARDTDEVLFADLWRRQDLAPRDRSMVTFAALTAMGQPEQLTFHVNRAMDNGVSEAEIGAALCHLAYYVGWPRVMSAVGAVRRIVDDRKAAQK